MHALCNQAFEIDMPHERRPNSSFLKRNTSLIAMVQRQIGRGYNLPSNTSSFVNQWINMGNKKFPYYLEDKLNKTLHFNFWVGKGWGWRVPKLQTSSSIQIYDEEGKVMWNKWRIWFELWNLILYVLLSITHAIYLKCFSSI